VNKVLKETSKNNVKLKFQSSQEAVGVNVQKELDERNLQNMRKSSEPQPSSSRKKKSDLQSSEEAAQNEPLQFNIKTTKQFENPKPNNFSNSKFSEDPDAN
jgi:hypothetical protein